MERTTVHINAGHGYDVVVGSGLRSAVGNFLMEISNPCRVAIICDDAVEGLYLSAVRKSIRRSGFDVVSLAIPHGEENKNLATFAQIVEFLAASQLSRTDLVVALGGGVVGDMAGFAAATYLRGIRCVQIPTTLLAAVDSSVGGKTAVDLSAGKNLVGAFHQPSAVICDVETLDTLPDAVFSDGMAEALKYGVLCDDGLFKRLATSNPREDAIRTISRCVDIKRAYVEADEFEGGLRRFLNLGHTIGHAIEKCSGFAIPHGSAVAVGMIMMARACEANDDAVPGTADRIADACRNAGLPTTISEAVAAADPARVPDASTFTAQALAEAARSDKKRSGNTITIVGVHTVGDCFLKGIPVDRLQDVIAAGMPA